MQENIQQMGYWHKGLGTFVYHDQQPQRAQMGDLFSDILSTVTGSAKTAAGKQYDAVVKQAEGLPDVLKQKAISSFLDTPTGQTFQEEAKKGWIQTQADKVKVIYTQNKSTIQNIALASGAIMIALVMYKSFSAGRRYAPRAAAPAAAGNPRRRRKHRAKRHSRRRRK